MQHFHQSHLSSSGAAAISLADADADADAELKQGKKRGNYNCGRCGLPKKGHSCHVSPSSTDSTPADSSASTRPLLPRQPSQLRRALSFDETDNVVRSGFETDADETDDFGVLTEDREGDLGSCGLPASCLWEVLRRLPPTGLLWAARVCKGWRETTKRLWRAAEVLKLRVPAIAQIGFVGSVLRKCPGLVSLSLRMERLGFLIGLS